MLVIEALRPLAVGDGELTAITVIVVGGALLMLVIHEIFALAGKRMDRPDHSADDDEPGERRRDRGDGE